MKTPSPMHTLFSLLQCVQDNLKSQTKHSHGFILIYKFGITLWFSQYYVYTVFRTLQDLSTKPETFKWKALFFIFLNLFLSLSGTEKVRQALGCKHLHVVNPDWLWGCLERWEQVEECLFPLKEDYNKSHRYFYLVLVNFSFIPFHVHTLIQH